MVGIRAVLNEDGSVPGAPQLGEKLILVKKNGRRFEVEVASVVDHIHDSYGVDFTVLRELSRVH